jgi:hypothetical protein
VCVVGGGRWSSEEGEKHPPIASGLFSDKGSDSVELGRGVRIDRLSDADASLVISACLPRGHYFKPLFQFGQRYSFVRDVGPEEWEPHPFRWDPERVIWDALVLSRLAHDNGHSTEFAARITDYEDGEQRVVYEFSPEGRNVYMLREGRDWLDRAEGADLAVLLSAYWKDRPPLTSRLGRAMWRMEYASWMAWSDVVLPILVSGLEALLKTDRGKATRQFARRVPQLAGELGIGGLDATFCQQMYDARSKWIHGAHVRLFGSTSEQDPDAAGAEPPTQEELSRLADIARLQDVLRSAVRRCIEDPVFRAIFDEDDLIRVRWPLG